MIFHHNGNSKEHTVFKCTYFNHILRLFDIYCFFVYKVIVILLRKYKM